MISIPLRSSSSPSTFSPAVTAAKNKEGAGACVLDDIVAWTPPVGEEGAE